MGWLLSLLPGSYLCFLALVFVSMRSWSSETGWHSSALLLSGFRKNSRCSERCSYLSFTLRPQTSGNSWGWNGIVQSFPTIQSTESDEAASDSRVALEKWQMEGSTDLGLNVCDLQSQSWAQSLPLLLTSCVAMDRLFLFLKLQFLICKMNNMTALL